MGATALIPASEYLRTVYRPDREYLDGQLVERNVGEYTHARLQGLILMHLMRNESRWKIRAVPECRVQVRPERFRIPDVCALRAEAPVEQVIETPPLLCVEILSPEDRVSEMQERIDDYLAMSVAYVWTVDPRTRRAWVTTTEGSREVRDGIVRAGDLIQVPLAELFD